jgi:hypothetical protein
MNSLIQNLPRPPTKKERQAEMAGTTMNPFKLFRMLTLMQHLQFWSAWCVDHVRRTPLAS